MVNWDESTLMNSGGRFELTLSGCSSMINQELEHKTMKGTVRPLRKLPHGITQIIFNLYLTQWSIGF
jgi:hypothetical protein